MNHSLTDLEITDFKTSTNKTIKIITILTSIICFISWITAILYFKDLHQISNFHFIETNNLPIKFEVNIAILYLFAFITLFIKLQFIFFLIIDEDTYILSILNERANYSFITNDILMALGISCPIIIPSSFDSKTIVIICMCICCMEIGLQAYCYTKFKNKRNINWRVQICYFLYTDMRIVFNCFQLINGFFYYLFNLMYFYDLTIQIWGIALNCLLFLVGIMLITYFNDIFYMIIYSMFNIGLMTGGNTGGLSIREFCTCLSLFSMSILVILYVLVKYKEKIWGDKSFSDELLRNYNENTFVYSNKLYLS